MKNATKAKLKAGRTAIGIRLDFTSPDVVESLGNLGFDFVYFDLEHGPTGEEACREMIRAAELVGLTPLVRVPFNEPGVVARFLDSGALGIIFPHCNTRQDARAAVKAVKYPPDGERGLGGRSLSLSGLSVAGDHGRRHDRGHRGAGQPGGYPHRRGARCPLDRPP
jgi:4-hydroxy-2-oxoheptanedioate aldolase